MNTNVYLDVHKLPTLHTTSDGHGPSRVDFILPYFIAFFNLISFYLPFFCLFIMFTSGELHKFTVHGFGRGANTHTHTTLLITVGGKTVSLEEGVSRGSFMWLCPPPRLLIFDPWWECVRYDENSPKLSRALTVLLNNLQLPPYPPASSIRWYDPMNVPWSPNEAFVNKTKKHRKWCVY